jgi:hypothetical protein
LLPVFLLSCQIQSAAARDPTRARGSRDTKAREWRPAAVISLDSASLLFQRATTTTGQVDALGNVRLQSTPDYTVSSLHTYLLETEDDLVVVDHWLRWLWSKPCRASVGDQIHWTPTKSGMRIKCRADDEHDVNVGVRISKPPDSRGRLRLAYDLRHRRSVEPDVIASLSDCASVVQFASALEKAPAGQSPEPPGFLKTCDLSVALARVAGKGYLIVAGDDGDTFAAGFADEITVRPGHFAMIFLPDGRIEVILPAVYMSGRAVPGIPPAAAAPKNSPPVTSGFGRSFPTCAAFIAWQKSIMRDVSQFESLCEKVRETQRGRVRVLRVEGFWDDYFADEVPTEWFLLARAIFAVFADGRVAAAVRTESRLR